jgi:tRNA A37 threonylcarbamoyladenosine modification protein TsaB
VGLATAKMLAMAAGKLVVPIDTLAAIAHRFARHHRQVTEQQTIAPVRLVTALNAFRKQVFTASWLVDASDIHNVRPACVVDAAQWLADPWGADTSTEDSSVAGTAGETCTEVWLSGSGLSLYAPPAAVEDQPNVHYRCAATELWQPLAEDVGQLGWHAYQLGQGVSAADLAPNYIRASAAEERAKG